MSRPFECRCTESDTMLEPAFSSRADFGSKKSALRPTSCTGQLTLVVAADDAVRRPIGVVVEPTCVRQIMWWNTKRPPTVCAAVAAATSTSLTSLISSAAT